MNVPRNCDDPVGCYFIAYTTFKLEEYVNNLEVFLKRDGVYSRYYDFAVDWKAFIFHLTFVGGVGLVKGIADPGFFGNRDNICCLTAA